MRIQTTSKTCCFFCSWLGWGEVLWTQRISSVGWTVECARWSSLAVMVSTFDPGRMKRKHVRQSNILTWHWSGRYRPFYNPGYSHRNRPEEGREQESGGSNLTIFRSYLQNTFQPPSFFHTLGYGQSIWSAEWSDQVQLQLEKKL